MAEESTDGVRTRLQGQVCPSRPKKPSVAYIERIFGNQAALLNLNIKSLTFFGWEQ